MKNITQNKTARMNYNILNTYEAGIELSGSEVKSCRMGRANLSGSYGRVEKGEVFLVEAHISPYPFSNRFNHEPLRKRKLLLHKREIKRLYGKIREKGQTFIPLKMYFNERGRVKVEMALVTGKKTHDRREDIKRKDMQREVEKHVKYKNR